jgi:hypothetical protein
MNNIDLVTSNDKRHLSKVAREYKMNALYLNEEWA